MIGFQSGFSSFALRAAMIRALKALQDKIRSLELERASASSRFQHIAGEMQQQQAAHTEDSDGTHS